MEKMPPHCIWCLIIVAAMMLTWVYTPRVIEYVPTASQDSYIHEREYNFEREYDVHNHYLLVPLSGVLEYSTTPIM
jgi:hypothetical protein